MRYINFLFKVIHCIVYILPIEIYTRKECRWTRSCVTPFKKKKKKQEEVVSLTPFK